MEEIGNYLYFQTETVKVKLDRNTLSAVEFDSIEDKPAEYSLERPLYMGILFNALKGVCFAA